jgi:hypothetical protein
MKKWRDINNEFNNREKFKEVEKFMIYVEFEHFTELDEDLEDRLLTIAADLRCNLEYATATGMGIAVMNFLYKACDDAEIDADLIGSEVSEAVRLLTDEEIIDSIQDSWLYGDWH